MQHVNHRLKPDNQFVALTARIVGVALFILGATQVGAKTAEFPLTGSVVQSPIPSRMGVFEEPLIAAFAPDSRDVVDLERAINAYRERAQSIHTEDIEQYLSEHPHSAWQASLWLNIGLARKNAGDYSEAIAAFERAYSLTSAHKQKISNTLLYPVRSRALAELISLHAHLGHTDKLSQLLQTPAARVAGGILASPVAQAKDTLWLMQNYPEEASRCGLAAIAELLRSRDPHASLVKFANIKAKAGGLSLADLQEISANVGLNLIPVQRQPGEAIPDFAVVHWKAGHYAAIIGQRTVQGQERYHVQDAALQRDFWMTREAIERESSGYFMVAADPITARESSPSPIAWRSVPKDEARKVFGSGPTTGGNPGGTSGGIGGGRGGRGGRGGSGGRGGGGGNGGGDNNDGGDCPCGGSGGMARYAIKSMLISLTIEDTPVSYTPPKGPEVPFTITYSQLEANQPATFTYSNLGQKWTHNWLAYIQDDPQNLGSNTLNVLAGGGSRMMGNFTAYGGSGSSSGGGGTTATGGTVTGGSSSGSGGTTATGGTVTGGSSSASGGTTATGGTVTGGSSSGSGGTTATGGTVTGGSSSGSGGTTVTINDPINTGSSVGKFSPEARTGTTLVMLSSNPIVYERIYPDGSKDVYAQPDGSSSSPRRIFLTQRSDSQGNVTNLTYDSSLRLTTITDALGQKTTLQYNNTDPLLITGVTDPFGRTASFNYDSQGRLISSTDAMGMISSFTYGSGTDISAMTTPYGTTSFTTGQNGRQRWIVATDPLGQSEQVEYVDQAPGIPYSENAVPNNDYNSWLNYRNTYFWDKAAFKLAASSGGTMDYTQARYRHWAHDYVLDPSWKTVSSVQEGVKYPLESRIWYTHPDQVQGNANSDNDEFSTVGRVLDDGSTNLTSYTYNSIHNIASVIDPAGRETDYVYDANQIDVLQIKRKTSSGYDILAQYTYNSQHQPLSYTDAAGQAWIYTYNAAGQRTSVANPNHETTQYQYNSKSYLVKVINANEKTSATYTYDSVGRIASSTDSQGYVIKQAYDKLDRPTVTTYPDGTTRHVYYRWLDVNGETNRLKETVTYTYDANRRLKQQVYNGAKTQYSYYENGLLKTRTDPDGHVTQWMRDIEGRVTSRLWADGTTTSYGYDGADRLVSVTDALGQTKTIAYTVDGQIASMGYTGAVNATAPVAFTYDPSYARPVSMQDGTGLTEYTYVPAGQLGANQILGVQGPYTIATIGYGYDVLGRKVSRTVAGVTEAYGYDKLGRLTSHQNGLGSFSYGYLGETNQATKQKLAATGLEADYQYLPNSGDRRLAAIQHSPVVSGGALDVFVSSDVEGRVTARNDWPQGIQDTYTYDTWDHLSSVNRGVWMGADQSSNAAAPTTGVTATSYTLDGFDNIQSITTTAAMAPIPNAVVSYSWDAENRLIGLSRSNGLTSQMQYDGLSRRIAIIEGGTDSVTGVTTASETRYLWCGEEICAAYAPDGTVTARYYPQGELVGGTARYYARDQIGSVMQVTDANGNRLASLQYDAYGNIQQSNGVLPQFGYAGMFYHAPSGLYLTHYREYDPFVGRWLNRDPIAEAGGINLTAYVGGNPISKTDPSGLKSVEYYLQQWISSSDTWAEAFSTARNGKFGPFDPNDPFDDDNRTAAEHYIFAQYVGDGEGGPVDAGLYWLTGSLWGFGYTGAKELGLYPNASPPSWIQLVWEEAGYTDALHLTNHFNGKPGCKKGK